MSQIPPVLTVALLLTSGLGCSSLASDRAKDDVEASTDAVDTAGDGGTVDTLDDPVSWGVGGSLTLTDGELTASAPVLRSQEPECVAAATLTTLTLLEAPVDENVPLLASWLVELTLDPSADCSPAAPLSFTLGIGPTDEALGPAADRAGVSASHSYGLYVQEARRPLYLVGVVGTSAQLDGTAEPLTEPPLADGEYVMVTLFGIPVTP